MRLSMEEGEGEQICRMSCEGGAERAGPYAQIQLPAQLSYCEGHRYGNVNINSDAQAQLGDIIHNHYHG